MMHISAHQMKDKRIEVAGMAFVAEVHLLNGVVIPCGRHLTLIAAQKALAKYPPDVFEGCDDPARLIGALMAPKTKRPVPPPSMRSLYRSASDADRGRLRSAEECANWNEPYSRLYDRRC